MIRRPPRSTLSSSSAASDVYKRQSWCTDRPDLVAAGYGSFEFGGNKNGLVCIWSLKNPNYPLWSFTTEAGVTALDFSTVSGGVLAVGLYSGHIAVYDVKSRNSEPNITSYGVPGKHHDPVWKLKWTDTGNVASTLVSISTDGRVTCLLYTSPSPRD